MSKYSGTVGFGVTEETSPGVNTVSIVERKYKGEVLKITRRFNQGESINDNIRISNTISILGNPYAFENFHNIRYITWMGTKWKVESIDVQYPRLNMTIGGEYNEESPETP